MQTVKKLTGFGKKDQKATKLVPQYLQLAVCLSKLPVWRHINRCK